MEVNADGKPCVSVYLESVGTLTHVLGSVTLGLQLKFADIKLISFKKIFIFQ